MSKIVRFYETGGPEKLILEDAPTQQPGAGEVRLRVQAMGLNRAEALFLRGRYMDQPVLPSRIGYEASGIVEAVGPGVDAAWLGKRASSIPAFRMSQYGVLGEEAIVPIAALAEYPANLSPLEGAAIWMQYLTAYGALVSIGRIQPAEHVIVTAASSSVGLAAIQIVKAEGATSIATTRTEEKRQELLALGANHVIATDTEDLPQRVQEITGGRGARVVFDPVAGPLLEKLAAATSQGGLIVEYGNLSMQPTPFPLLAALSKGLSLRGYTLHEITPYPALLAHAKDYVVERLKDARFMPKIARAFPLAQVADAFRYLESNAQVGKVVVTV